ncbi:Vegetative incompatibility protein HET-E-1 [Rhizoctonia solani]|uniref:Vegetative incompatibility protein HET-E-1 n=1 Tax=Rhizoctonia solani TaxID=456999 RepID=A0A8H8T2F0_9AGAM|nr:Vegetative incompatibility protein HET-E-1 [Rhizoctonia solani]QRW26274.1 Vegetative incompatibility protein HET-E-1 [Rhizoctonia solani]
MMQHNSQSRVVIHLHKIERSLVRTDIELFLKGELSSTSATPLEIDQLVERSGALFTYASMLVRFVTSGEPQKRLETVPVLTPTSGEEYAPEDGEKEDIRFVLQTVLVAQEPNGIEIIVILAEINGLEREYMRFGLYDKDAVDIEDRIRTHIPSTLMRTCRYGGNRLELALRTDYLLEILGDFLSNQFLFWMDVIDIRQETTMEIGTLIKAKDWLVTVSTFHRPYCELSLALDAPHLRLIASVLSEVQSGVSALLEVHAWAAASVVCSVAYDPQGAHAPVGCYGDNLSTRNAHGGDLVLGPFEINGRDLGDDTGFLMGPLTITGCVVPPPISATAHA